jgi:hypothetical protein
LSKSASLISCLAFHCFEKIRHEGNTPSFRYKSRLLLIRKRFAFHPARLSHFNHGVIALVSTLVIRPFEADLFVSLWVNCQALGKQTGAALESSWKKTEEDPPSIEFGSTNSVFGRLLQPQRTLFQCCEARYESTGGGNFTRR